MSDAQTNLEIYLPFKPEKLFVRKNQNDKKGIFYIREDILISQRTEPIDDNDPPVKILRGNRKVIEYIRKDIVDKQLTDNNQIIEAAVKYIATKREHFNVCYDGYHLQKVFYEKLKKDKDKKELNDY